MSKRQWLWLFALLAPAQAITAHMVAAISATFMLHKSPEMTVAWVILHSLVGVLIVLVPAFRIAAAVRKKKGSQALCPVIWAMAVGVPWRYRHFPEVVAAAWLLTVHPSVSGPRKGPALSDTGYHTSHSCIDT